MADGTLDVIVAYMSVGLSTGAKVGQSYFLLRRRRDETCMPTDAYRKHYQAALESYEKGLKSRLNSSIG